jgi:hypothetical protein
VHYNGCTKRKGDTVTVANDRALVAFALLHMFADVADNIVLYIFDTCTTGASTAAADVGYDSSSSSSSSNNKHSYCNINNYCSSQCATAAATASATTATTDSAVANITKPIYSC